MKRLSETQIDYALKTTLSRWRQDGDFICREFEFSDFVSAWGFMARVALIAERDNHHPNWENVYNRVIVRLSTHDAAGITEKDLQLAVAIDSCVDVP